MNKIQKDLDFLPGCISLLAVKIKYLKKVYVSKNWNNEQHFGILIYYYMRTLLKFLNTKSQPLLWVLFKQDVVSLSKKMKTKKNKMTKEDLVTGDKQGIKGLSKEKRKRLEAYQHLFYLLQVRLYWSHHYRFKSSSVTVTLILQWGVHIFCTMVYNLINL